VALASDTRPWGEWHILETGDGYQVKRLEVLPHQRLSYQTHEHRAEHWVVVRGIATCTLDGERVVLQVGDSLDIAIGAAHRIANEHDEPVEIIEVQRGSYTGDDDIVRLEDDYGR
jgi:mannose-6-phosphate isomerase